MGKGHPRATGDAIRNPQSAQTLDGHSGNKVSELSEIVRISSDDEVAPERRRSDYGCVNGVRASGACEQFARSLGELRCQRLDSTALE